MSTSLPGRRLALAGASLMSLTTLAHSSGLLMLSPQLAPLSPDLATLVRLLWLGAAFDFALIASLGWIVVAGRTSDPRLVLVTGAVQTTGTALLQLTLLGPIAPTALLALDALLFGLAAWRWQRAD